MGVTARDGVWIEHWPASGEGTTVAVKDLLDVEGSVTTAGCLALERRGFVAESDASCVASLRRAGAVIVGKTNLHELAYGTSGVNPWYGTAPNPVDPGRVPGGSSSGSAVAVALGECDVALGSDTGGSVRIPAACCGVVGLKTTWGRVPLEGVWPLAPSYDTVGPLARSVRGAAEGLALLEGLAGPVGGETPGGVGRLRLDGSFRIDPVIESALDEALASSELVVAEADLDGWREAWAAHQCLLDVEAWASDRELVETEPSAVGEEVRRRLLAASRRTPAEVAAAKSVRARFTAEMAGALGRYGVLALPTVPWRPPLLDEQWPPGFNALTAPVNLCGFPAVSLPVPVQEAGNWRVTGLQLIGPPGSEEALLAVAGVVEAAAGWRG